MTPRFKPMNKPSRLALPPPSCITTWGSPTRIVSDMPLRLSHSKKQWMNLVPTTTSASHCSAWGIPSRQPPSSNALCRILRIRVGTEVTKNQPCHDIVVFREIRPVHAARQEQLQYRICLTRKCV